MVNWNPELWSEPMQRGTMRRPRSVPKAFWRRVVWVRNVYLGIWGVGSLIWLLSVLNRGRPFLGIGIILGAVLVFSLAPRVAKRRMLRDLRDGDYCICLDCGYCLKGLPAHHSCPECATAFDMEQVQNAWRHWERHNRLPKELIQSEASTH